MVRYYVLLPKHQKEIGQVGYLLGMSQGAFTANSPRLISPLKIEPKSCNPTTGHTP